MHVYRPKRSRVWWIRWRDHRGGDHRWKGFTDRRATEATGHRLEALAASQVSGAPIKAELLRWVSDLPGHRRIAIVRLGLLGAHGSQLWGSLADHREAYRAHLEARDRSPRHIAGTVNRSKTALDGLGVTRITDLDAGKVEAWLKGRRDKGLSVASSNHYLTALKGFVAWMVREGRALRNPIADLSRLPDSVDRRHDRTALEPEQLDAMLSATRKGPVRFGCNGEQRYWLYRVAAETGLRRGELKGLRVADFDLGDEPAVTVQAAYSRKRKLTQTIPLARATADGLLEYLESLEPGDPAFKVPHYTAGMLKEDLEAAGIDYTDGQGRFRDFHALRHTFITEAGYVAESFADLQALARHASPAMTARYAHPREQRMREAVERLSR